MATKGLWPALSTMRAAGKVSQQQIPVHSAPFYHPETHADRLVLVQLW